ncbi:MFS transporter [Acetomicrobium sp.]|uniref:MFS transporter n=1 Tax=Acetomicrobium sp. TaxID=1872099 RepID=UPI002872966C|nr:MFS transporter [Acetomicrobium sp.]MDR9770530.1 MFS transporter [Acetomicrobium sp.]
MGINTAATYLGLSSGPFFGGILVQNFGWKSIFVTAGALGLFVLYTILRHIKTEWVASKEKPFDILGSFFVCNLPALVHVRRLSYSSDKKLVFYFKRHSAFDRLF